MQQPQLRRMRIVYDVVVIVIMITVGIIIIGTVAAVDSGVPSLLETVETQQQHLPKSMATASNAIAVATVHAVRTPPTTNVVLRRAQNGTTKQNYGNYDNTFGVDFFFKGSSTAAGGGGVQQRRRAARAIPFELERQGKEQLHIN